MNKKSLLALIGCAALAIAGSLQAQQLVTNGDFSAGSTIFGGSPTNWNATVGAPDAGQFTPGGGPYTPLSGQMAYMGNSQIVQTFSVLLQANTTYTVSFDVFGSVGDFSGINSLNGAVSYGTGSGGTSGFAGGIDNADILVPGTQNFSAPVLGLTASSFSTSFTTAGTIVGSANNLAIYLNPVFAPSGGLQLYVDNISVTAVPEPSTYALLAVGLGIIVVLRRRRRMA